MKKTLLIALLLIPFLGFSQTIKPIDGFLGIKFGSSKVVVLAAIEAKGGTLNKDNSKPDMFYFENVKLGHREAAALLVRFVNDKCYQAQYFFTTDVEAKVIVYYNDLVKDFNDVYGQGNTIRNFTQPYQEGDGNELLGLSAGKIDFRTLWVDNNKNYIKVSINTSMQVVVNYIYESIAVEARAKEKAQEKSDY